MFLQSQSDPVLIFKCQSQAVLDVLPGPGPVIGSQDVTTPAIMLPASPGESLRVKGIDHSGCIVGLKGYELSFGQAGVHPLPGADLHLDRMGITRQR